MRKGFTIVELLVVIAISAMLSAITLTYTNISRNQVALSVETSKVAQTILRAKDLAVATYNASPKTCAYGVSFDFANNRYSIFAYNPSIAKYGTIPPCPTAASSTAKGISNAEMGQYSAATWNTAVTNGVKISAGSNGDGLRIVIFYPPDPDTVISRNGTTFLSPGQTSKVYLMTADGRSKSEVTVNAQGQITF